MQRTPPVEQSIADSAVKLSTSRQWPGERHPTRWDVLDANESPATTFVNRFRAALLHSEGAEEDALLDWDLDNESSDDMNTSSPDKTIGQLLANLPEQQQDPVKLYTYPMVLLSEAATILPEDELARLGSLFFTSFNRHIFLSAVDVADPSSKVMPPYLPLALACLASVTSPLADIVDFAVASGNSPAQVSAGLFSAGANLWSVMLELDNREARLFEAVVAASLLITYGILSADRRTWRKTSGILCNVVTITRRVHLTDSYSPLYASGEFPDKDFGMKSSLASYMLLIDTVHAIHYGLAPNYSVSELFIKMPSSNHQFRTVYNSLTHGYTLPKDVTTQEDAFLLLTALLSDITYMQRCRPSLPFLSTYNASGANDQSTHIQTPLRNPYAPLSSQSESSRMAADMLVALSRWKQHFQHRVGSDIYALYYFSRLQLICPNIWELPHLAGYGVVAGSSNDDLKSSQHTKKIDISDKAMDLAWLVLDSCDKRPEPLEGSLAIWLPIVLFLSALVVWQRLRSQPVADLKYGTLKVLSMFSAEITQLPWPCCIEMANTLNMLMKK
ncbi:hypothetical protein F5884DRAFT_115638 [Xylogone sp. PMI_703]|nr:hypothetical protein F5884DRAFT_115638 [Xylogone sp. PMI_703]